MLKNISKGKCEQQKSLLTYFQISSENNSDNNIKRQKPNDNEFELHPSSSWSD